MSKVKSKLPPLYHHFLPDLIEEDVPEETWASCHTCTLCQSAQSPYVNTKCCAYFPSLYNYLIGGILQDTRPEMAEGKKRMKALIAAGVGVTPYGIVSPDWHTQEYRRVDNKSIQLQAELDPLLCPLYKSGTCTIWDYRGNLCSTYHCVSNAAVWGKKYWKTVNTYLKTVEHHLGNYALSSIGFNEKNLLKKHLKKYSLEFGKKKPMSGNDNELWGEWINRKEELYVACYEYVMNLTQDSFDELIGEKHAKLITEMSSALVGFRENQIPEFLKWHPDVCLDRNTDGLVIVCLKEEKVEISPIVFNYLKKMDGTIPSKKIVDYGFEILLNLSHQMLDLYQKDMLRKF